MSIRSFFVAPLIAGSTLFFAGCDPQLTGHGPATKLRFTPIHIDSVTVNAGTIKVCGHSPDSSHTGLGEVADTLVNHSDTKDGDHLVIWLNQSSYNASQYMIGDKDCIVGRYLPNESAPAGKVAVFVATEVYHLTITEVDNFDL